MEGVVSGRLLRRNRRPRPPGRYDGSGRDDPQRGRGRRNAQVCTGSRLFVGTVEHVLRAVKAKTLSQEDCLQLFGDFNFRVRRVSQSAADESRATDPYLRVVNAVAQTLAISQHGGAPSRLVSTPLVLQMVLTVGAWMKTGCGAAMP